MRRLVLAISLIFSSSIAALAQGALLTNPTAQNYAVDRTGYSPGSGPYSTFQFMFDLAFGIYTENTFVNATTFPAGTIISWTVPTPKSSACVGVCGFPQQSYGNYDGGSANGVACKAISAINTLSETYSLAFNDSGNPNGFDVIDDIFLNSSCVGNTHVAEVSIFYHQTATDCSGGYSSFGTSPVTLSGISFNVVKSGGATPQICLLPASGTDLTSATIDLLAMINYLAGVSGSPVTTSLVYGGHAIGGEPISGAGGFTINSRSTTYN